MKNIHIITLLLIIILIAILYNNKNKSESFYDSTLDDKIQCAANYGTQLGNKVCCGQSGNIEDIKYVCPKEKPICQDYIYNVQWGQCKTLAQCNNDDLSKKNVLKKMQSHPLPIGSTIERGNTWSTPQKQSAGHKAYCRCVSNDDTKGISICNTGCGSPNQICNTNFGCTPNDRGCNKDRCTCKPENITGNTMSYKDCSEQCKRINMKIPANSQQVSIAKNTGCGINGKQMWVQHKGSEIKVKPHSDPSPIGNTIKRGNTWSTPQRKNAGEKAYCRCVSKDNTKGISVCNTGCGSPNQICNKNFGCTPSNRGCNRNRCTCKPENISGNTMTYKECSEQCNRVNMKMPANSQEVSIAKNTGCGINGREMWVQHKGSEGNEKACRFKISGNCRTYPQMSNHNWFNDDKYGGPRPSTKEACEQRKSSWEHSCNLPSGSIDMDYNNGGGGRGDGGTQLQSLAGSYDYWRRF